MHADIGTVTNRTLRRNRGRIATVMATQHILALVIDEAHITIDALRHIMAFVTLQTQRKTASVLEQNSLVVLVQSFLHRVKQGAAKVGFHGLATAFHTHVAEDNLGHLHTTITLGDFHQMVTAAQGIEITLV